MTDAEFRSRFKELTGHEPLRWQRRLFREYFVSGQLPPVIDLPTGLGKTMVIAIWLIARELNKAIPRRLIYVVDRRTVVDQATDIAVRLVMRPITKWMHDHFRGQPPTISTLRGQLADNREWSRDPTRPAIIIGTVDLIGSALLFSSYRSSYKRRPLEAGLLGQDSLLVLDEAHLSKPFEKLVKSIVHFQRDQGSPLKVIRMSATSGDSIDDSNFQLDTDPSSPTYDLQPDPDPNTGEERNQIVTRFNAQKRLTIETADDAKKLNDALCNHAIALATNDSLRGKRIVVFVRSPENAKSIARSICDHDKPSKSKSNPDPKGPFADSVEVLTGTMRGLERDEFVEKQNVRRFLDGNIDPADQANQQPVFLVSTSAGEVGFDLNADHMVCDAAPLDSMIQRLGRVNRRGQGDAMVRLILEKEPAGKSDMDKACIVASKLFVNGMDVSPKAITEFKSNLSADELKSASTPEPTMVELTDILLDAWSMTSITDRMPGRPEVGPWLRGIADDLPQTTIAWRAEMELFKHDSNSQNALKAIFTKHHIRPHESITTNSYHVVEFLKQVCKLRDRPSDLPNTEVALRLSRGKIVLRTIRELAEEPGILNAEPTLILPATFGGLDAAGMLDAEAIPKLAVADDSPRKSLDVADHSRYEQRDDASPRLRLIIRRTEDGTWVPECLPGGVVISERLQLQPAYPTSTALFADLRKTDLRIRLVQPIELNDEGDAVRSLVMLTPLSNRNKPEDQSLAGHVGAVVDEAKGIVSALGLAQDDPVRNALLFAARWHDEGKKAGIWQRFVYGPDAAGEYKGKSSRSRDPKSLLGYRHEFGSLLRIHLPERLKTDCSLPSDPETRELALHLIATHHGFGRPHFASSFDRDFNTEQCQGIHAEVIRRFARLQRKYGWWRLAWLENLLRCADALASADPESDDMEDSAGGDE